MDIAILSKAIDDNDLYHFLSGHNIIYALHKYTKINNRPAVEVDVFIQSWLSFRLDGVEQFLG